MHDHEHDHDHDGHGSMPVYQFLGNILGYPKSAFFESPHGTNGHHIIAAYGRCSST